MSTPICPGCKSKFQHDAQKQLCKTCGLPDETIAAGLQAVRRWQKRHNLTVSRGGSFQRRKRAHGRAQGGSKAKGLR